VHVQTGGAGRFLQTLRDEIIPLVESDYRALPTDRGLAGYSFGGLFALYALFQSGGLFSKFLAGSPSMWASLFEDEEEYAALNTDLPAKLFLTAGSLEQDLLQPIQHMVDRLRKRAYPNLDVRNYVFEGEGHVSATAAAISRALNLLYYADHSNN
jgi:predicted alpha/beta superfamily hydrolase